MAQNLPDEILGKIFAYVDEPKDWLKLSSCNKQFFKVTKSLIENDCCFSVDMKNVENFVNYQSCQRKYKLFQIVRIHKNAEQNLIQFIKTQGNVALKLSFLFGNITLKSLLEVISSLQFIENLYFMHLNIDKDVDASKVSVRIPTLKELYFTDLSVPIEIFQHCTNLKAITCLNDFREAEDENGMSLEQLICKQTALETLEITEDVRFSGSIAKCKFRLKKLKFKWIATKHWYPWLTFLDNQNMVEELEMEVISVHDPREDPNPDAYLEAILTYIFTLGALKKLKFEYDGCQYMKVRPGIFRKVKENRNLESVCMSVIDGPMGSLFNSLVKNSPNIKTLEFCIGEKLPQLFFNNVNALSALSTLHIYKCQKADFKLSKINLGNNLLDFVYSLSDLKLTEWRNFFKNNSKINRLALIIKKLNCDQHDLIYAITQLKELKTLQLYIKGINEPLQELIKTNLKYLIEIIVQDPILDEDEMDEEESDMEGDENWNDNNE